MGDIEKQRREYYQGIVYDICNIVDSWKCNPVGKTQCGTFDTPCTELQETIKKLIPIASKPDNQFSSKRARHYEAFCRLNKIKEKNEGDVFTAFYVGYHKGFDEGKRD